MLKAKMQKGFTLVELAIVLVIIGLLIGGILKGQELLQNSRVTATVAQVKGIEAATTNFRDVYGGLPGDLKNSDVKINGCPGDGSNAICLSANADGAVGVSNWDMFTYQPAAEDGTATCSVGGAGACVGGNETLLFWYSLQSAGLISGVTASAITVGDNPAFAKTHPTAKIRGGFWVGNSLTGTPADASDGRPSAAGQYTLLGTILSLVKAPGNDLTFGKKAGVLTPATAANIDRKLDDGLPHTGSVQAYGHDPDAATVSTATDNASCYGDAATNPAYQESVKDLDCGIHIRIQQ